MKRFTINRRLRVLVNTDPQRRCYNGCHFSLELRWTDWESFESGIPESKLEHKMKFWRELNDYAISQRGEGARAEYVAVEEALS